IPPVNLDAIADLATREVVRQLLNLIETLAGENAALRLENQQLRDEIARLKGGSSKPDIKPPVSASTDHSSEVARRVRTPRGKPKKNALLTVTREWPCPLDPATLPPDATRHDVAEVIMQDLVLKPEVIRFVREVWLAPSTGQTIIAPLPAGYTGGFGPHIRALALALGHGANVSQPALLRFFHDAGIAIGKGTLARWLSDHTAQWAEEADAIHLAGLSSGAWQASDQTATRVDGHNEVCHVVGNAQFTSYHTRPGGSRQDVLAVLWGIEPVFRLNADAEAWLEESTLSARLLGRLRAAVPWDREMSAVELAAYLAAGAVMLNTQQRQQVGDALAIAAYHAQADVPIVRLLLSDDAAVFHGITDAHALCWVHDGRHYAKLAPVVAQHQAVLAEFRRDYWALYRDLVAYRAAPSAQERARLAQAFDQVMARRTGYDDLDARIAKTAYNRDLLLAVLDTPALPLHNNDMELAARRRVRKRDVSFGPQSRAGAQAWDTFQTIAATAAKQGVRLYQYLCERLLHPATTPSLAERIAERSCYPALNPT
ncbi:MAG: transposase, partial [Roseiflexaceae bacterium]